MLLFRTKEDLGAVAVKEYSTFPKDIALLESHHQIILCHIQDTCCWGSLINLQRCNQCIMLTGLKQHFRLFLDIQTVFPLTNLVSFSFPFLSKLLNVISVKNERMKMLYTRIIKMHIYTYTCRIHIDTIIKTSEDFFKKYTSHFT